jgi:hypothetical protein
MKEKIITLATEIAKADCLIDYDDTVQLTIADAITLLVMESVSHDDDMFMHHDSSEIYDFIQSIIKN